MSITELANFGEFVSGLAVVVSLIYLALQTRQNAKHTMALIHQGATNQATARMGQFAGDPILADIMLRATAGDTTLQDVDILRYIFSTMATLTNFADQYFQHRQGLLDEGRIRVHGSGRKAQCSYPRLSGRVATPQSALSKAVSGFHRRADRRLTAHDPHIASRPMAYARGAGSGQGSGQPGRPADHAKLRGTSCRS